MAPGGCTKYIRSGRPGVSLSKIYKSRYTEEYDNWFRNGEPQYTEVGNMRRERLRSQLGI